MVWVLTNGLKKVERVKSAQVLLGDHEARYWILKHSHYKHTVLLTGMVIYLMLQIERHLGILVLHLHSLDDSEMGRESGTCMRRCKGIKMDLGGIRGRVQGMNMIIIYCMHV